MGCFMYVVAILFPPIVPVYYRRGLGSFILNCALTLCGWLPGMLHAIWIVGQYNARNSGFGRGVYLGFEVGDND